MAQLTVYKASAGSGKTFQLVSEYLALIVDDPGCYRHILAVTFTNKATAEMKARILRALYALANEANPDFLPVLEKKTGENPEKIRLHARKALSLLLHDYDHFSVSTIDSFFQGVLRSFARESGLYGSYEVNLDEEGVLNEACDRMFLDMDHDPELFQWLLQMSRERLNQGKSWQIRDELLRLGYELQKEPFPARPTTLRDRDEERAAIKILKERLIKKQKVFENKWISLGQQGVKLLEKYGLTPDDFKFKSGSFASFFPKMHHFSGGTIVLGKRFQAALDDPENWPADKKNPGRVLDCYHGGMNELIRESIDFYAKAHIKYQTARELYHFIHGLGVLSSLSLKIREVSQEKNALLLSEANRLLRGIIGDNDAPFVYEKTGNYYHSFLFDEFQDTSLLQWENFKPLVVNSLAEKKPVRVFGCQTIHLSLAKRRLDTSGSSSFRRAGNFSDR